MAAYLTLYVDWFNKKLRDGITMPGSFIMPPITQGNVVPMKVYIIQPQASSTLSFSQVNISNMSLKLAVANAPEATPFVTFYDWDKDLSDGNGFFYTDPGIAFNTAELDTWMAGAAYKDGYLELEITEGSAVTTIYRNSAQRINATTVPASSEEVTPGQTPLSLEVGKQMFASKWMGNGETITIPSPSGTYATIIGCNDDGSTRMEVIALT